MQSFKTIVYTNYRVEAKLSSLREHPLSERVELLKKPKREEGPPTVIGYDLTEGMWTELFEQFSIILSKNGIKLKPPVDKAPHVSLAYIKNATDEEIEKIKSTVSTEITPFTVAGITFLLGQNKKDVYVALDLEVTSTYRKMYNAIQNLVGRERLGDFRTFWKGHIPHASIGIIDQVDKKLLKKLQKELDGLVKAKRIVFTPTFIEVHKDTKMAGLFTPELIDYIAITED